LEPYADNQQTEAASKLAGRFVVLITSQSNSTYSVHRSLGVVLTSPGPDSALSKYPKPRYFGTEAKSSQTEQWYAPKPLNLTARYQPSSVIKQSILCGLYYRLIDTHIH
jgi:hypothetical protein